MSTLTSERLALIVALAALYLFTCYRVSRWARLTGRRPVLWFFLTLLFTALPAAVVHGLGQARRSGRAASNRGASRPERRRCPHCGAQFEPGRGRDAGAVPECPRCGMAIDDTHIA